MEASQITALVNGVLAALGALGGLAAWLNRRSKADRRELRRIRPILEEAFGYIHRLRITITASGGTPPEQPLALTDYLAEQEDS